MLLVPRELIPFGQVLNDPPVAILKPRGRLTVIGRRGLDFGLLYAAASVAAHARVVCVVDRCLLGLAILSPFCPHESRKRGQWRSCRAVAGDAAYPLRASLRDLLDWTWTDSRGAPLGHDGLSAESAISH
jgi:hypothetical protein